MSAASPAAPARPLAASAILAASARRKLGSLAILAASTSATTAALSTFAAAAASRSFAGLAQEKVYVRRAFEGSTAAMALFVALSGWFLAGHFLEGRRREISLWLLTGMRRRLVLAELSIELAAATACGLGAGLAAGALLSRLFALALGALMRQGGIPELDFGPVPMAAGALAWILQLLIAAGRAAAEVSRSSIASLIRSDREPEEAPRRKRALAALGAACIAAGYAAACLSRGLLAELMMLPALGLTVAGTFLAFDALVPALAAALRARALRPSEAPLSAAIVFASAQIAFRSRRNSRTLALCSILVGMAASAAGTVATMAIRIGEEGSYGLEALFGALLFTGGFLAFAFALSATALLASRAASDAREDLGRRAALRDLGASRSVLRRSIAAQNAFFFGLPAVFGIAHSAAAMTMLRTFSGYPVVGPTLATGAATAFLLALAAASSISRQLDLSLGERRSF